MKITHTLLKTLLQSVTNAGFVSMLSLLVFTTTSVLHAQLTWLGTATDNPNSWSSADNWSGGLPSTSSGSPSEIFFTNNDLNGDTLTLDGVYYLHRLAISDSDYGVTEKNFAAPGTAGSMLVFQASDQANPSITVEMSNTNAGNNTRNLALSANLYLDNDLSIIRNGGGSANQLRRLLLNGTISGDASLTLSAGSGNSHGSRIELNGHNTFTGDVILTQGYLFQTHADGLGAFGKKLIFRNGSSFTWDITTATATQLSGVQTALDYNLHFDFSGTASRYILLHAGSINRQATIAGDITGGSINTVLHIIAQNDQQLIFTGDAMDFTGIGRIRYGSEVVLANANADGVAWENVSQIQFNEVAASGIQSTAFLLRGNYTFNGNLNYLDTATAATSEKISVGQINHQGQSFDAVFNGVINHAEKDIGIFNLIAENGGSATFTNSIIVSGQRGLSINDTVNPNTSGGTNHYYEATPKGTVVIANSSRVASSAAGTGSIGSTTIYNGVLAVNTSEFYSDVTIWNGAILSGDGMITGNVNAQSGGIIDAGYDANDSTTTGQLTINGAVTLNGSAGIKFQVEAATFNLDGTSIHDLPTLDPLLFSQIGLHDFIDIASELNVSETSLFNLEFLSGYNPVAGDVFHLLNFSQFNYTSANKSVGELWDLPDLSASQLYWNFDYLQSDGIIALVASNVWTGADGSNDNLWSNPANWSSGVPSIIDGKPSHITFSTNDLNGDVLDLNGQTYYLNTLTVEKAFYNSQVKELANNGTLVFQAGNGVNPVIHFTMDDMIADTIRSISISADIVLQDDTSIIRENGATATSSQRRIFFKGVISGDGDLYIDPTSNSSAGMISFTNHNSFTGDIYWNSGYISQIFADSLGTFDKTFYLGSGTQFTWDLTSTTAHRLAENVATAIGYHIDFGTTTKTFLLQAGSALRQLEISGNITGGTSTSVLHIISQNNQQIIFTGETMTQRGISRIRYGSEVVLANANSEGVAWQNISRIDFTESPTNAAHNGAFVLRGDYTFNGAFNISNTTEPASVNLLTNFWSIGQINHNGTAYQATFNGNITVAENAYRSLNLVSESNGSATFNGNIIINSPVGMDINKVINSVTSGGANNYYETTPEGTVVIGVNSRVASAANGTGSIGLVEIHNGRLRVDTQNFFADVDVHSGATLGGDGQVTGNVYVYDGGAINASGVGGSNTGSLVIQGNLELGGPSSIVFDISAATFNLNGVSHEDDLETIFANELQTVGDHDHITITGAFTAIESKSLKLNFLETYIPQFGDVFNLLDFVYFPNAEDDTLWDLPDLTEYSSTLFWKYDLLSSHGVLMIVPEPTRMMLLTIALASMVLFRRRRLLA